MSALTVALIAPSALFAAYVLLAAALYDRRLKRVAHEHA